MLMTVLMMCVRQGDTEGVVTHMSHCAACHTSLHIVLLFVMSMCSVYSEGIMCSLTGPQTQPGTQFVHITDRDVCFSISSFSHKWNVCLIFGQIGDRNEGLTWEEREKQYSEHYWATHGLCFHIQPLWNHVMIFIWKRTYFTAPQDDRKSKVTLFSATVITWIACMSTVIRNPLFECVRACARRF